MRLTEPVGVRAGIDSIANTVMNYYVGLNCGGIARMPSYSDTISSNIYTGSTAALIGLYYPQELLNNTYGSRQAPRGSIIFDNMFIRGAKRQEVVTARSGIQTVVPAITDPLIAGATLDSIYSNEKTNGGISTVTSYNGRVIYAVYENGLTSRDDNSPSFGDMIFFSKATDS